MNSIPSISSPVNLTMTFGWTPLHIRTRRGFAYFHLIHGFAIEIPGEMQLVAATSDEAAWLRYLTGEAEQSAALDAYERLEADAKAAVYGEAT